MTAVAKRQWGPQKTLSEGISIAIEWMERAKQKNILTLKEPTLYHAYVMNSVDEMVSWSKPLSEVFRWSAKDGPAEYRMRDAALRLLAVAFKAHFFSEGQDKIAHEPYLFALPDVAMPQRLQYGLFYRLEQSNKCIVVAEKDLRAMASGWSLKAMRFPVVLLDGESGQRNRWFSIKHWKTLEESKRYQNPARYKKEKEEASACKEVKEFVFGELFDIPYDLREVASSLGMEWAAGIKMWYLPHGFDIEPVKEYVSRVLAAKEK
jgi:hypothetical protein